MTSPSERRELRAGVIGAGIFGAHHAAKWAKTAGVTLAGVLDPHPERAGALTARFGGEVFADRAAFLAHVDVVSVCSPAVTHGACALAALRASKAVYVEKPIATDPADADAIVSEAARRGLTVACGFLERATFQAMGLFDAPEAPLRLEARRFGAPSPRNLDVSVVIDLMIHDLDLALALTGAAPLAVEAEGVCETNALFDRAEAEITFDDGFTAVLSASRTAKVKARTVRLVYPSGEVTIDVLNRTFSNTTAFALNPAFAQTRAGRDPLGGSLEAFLSAVRGERAKPLADAADGARALDLALAVEQAVGG